MPGFTNKNYLPGYVLAKHSAPGLSAHNVVSLMATSPNMKSAFRRPSQRKVAMSMLPSNFEHRLYGGVVLPRVMRGPNGRFTRGMGSMKARLNMHRFTGPFVPATINDKKRMIDLTRMNLNNFSKNLPVRVKTRLNKMLKNTRMNFNVPAGLSKRNFLSFIVKTRLNKMLKNMK